MKCPQCQENLSRQERQGKEVFECLYCEGYWLPLSSLNNLAEADENAPSPEHLGRLFESARSPANRICPACLGQHFNLVQIGDAEIDICPNCRSVFFDKGEVQQLLPSGMPAHASEEIGIAGIKALSWLCILLGLGQ